MNQFLPNLRVCLLLLCLSVLSAWAETKTYTIDFNKGTVSGSSINSNLPVNASTMCNAGAANIASFSGEACCYNASGCGIRIAKSNAAGSFKINLNATIKAETVEKVVVYASKVADNSKSALTVTPSGSVTSATAFSNSELPAYDSSKPSSTNYRLADIIINGTLNSLTFQAPLAGYVMLHRISIVTSDVNDSRTPVNITSFSADETTLVVGRTTNTAVVNDQDGWTAAYTYSSDNEAVATIDANGVITAVAKGTANITASLNIANDDANYKRGATSSKAVSITVNNLSHTAHFSVNGTIDPANDQLVEEGAVVPFPSDPEANGVVFRGWATAAIDGTQDAAPAMITKATETMGVNDVTYYAVFATATGGETQWRKVPISASLSSGVYALICSDGYAFNGDISNGQGARTSRAFSFTDNIATSAPDGTLELTLTVVGENQYTLYNTDHGYLYASGPSAGKLAWHRAESSYWSFESNKFKYEVGDSYAHLRYYNDLFRTYAPSTTSSEVPYLAKKISTTSYSNYRTTLESRPAETPEISFGEEEYWVSAGATIVSPTPTTNTDGAITYAVTSGDAATVDANTGAIALTGTTGDVTITATSAETANYQQGTASYTLHVVDPLSLSVSAARYATFAPSQNVELPAAGRDGTIRIYYYTQDPQDDAIAVSSAYEAIGEGGAIARGTGIIVKAEAGTVEFPVNSTVSPTELVGNKLVGVLENTPRDGKENAYIFKNGSQGIGFYPWLSGALAAGKCYLQLSDHQAPTFIGLEDEETDVHALPEAEESMPQTTEIYNLVGLRIRQMQRGMNIVNGKKVLK